LCLSRTSALHWEGTRNDQCETCDTGGILTKCTRCNLVWHASCLHPTPIFPLRRQHAVVCGEQCWAELNAAAVSARTLPPTCEIHTTKSRFLPHKYNTNSTTHSFPLVTRTGQQQPCAITTMDATEPTEQLSGSTEARTEQTTSAN
jgi:hypothetical protein